jgi:MOSC domain-containing protein YiiM
LRIGSQVVLAVLERDPRCKIVTLDPDTTAANPEVIKRLARDHQTRAGIYAAVLAEGRVQQGDEVYLLP